VYDELDRILILPSRRDYEAKIDELLGKKSLSAGFAALDDPVTQQVLEILRKVANEGDAAVAYWTERFDNVKLAPKDFRVSAEAMADAHKHLNSRLLESIRRAVSNVRKYQAEIFTASDRKCAGATGIKYMPLRRVGICVPGAAAPLASTVIMTAVPAQVAGVEEIAVVSPPRHKGGIDPVILAVCRELGIDEVYRIGGAQAVAALAFGTQSITKVEKIVGPGNKWVQAAKKMVSQDCVAIDSIAGPSEVLIIANDSAAPAWIAADMLSQAEHASDSTAVVVTDSQRLAESVIAELKGQVDQLSRAEDAKKSLLTLGAVVVRQNMAQVIDFANEFAAEHLQIECGAESRGIADRITDAGAIFIGDYCPVAVGDYWAGPSHTLPTGMRARFSSALTSNDFVKSISIIEYDRDRLAGAAEDIIRLAEVEGLDAHARSIRIRQAD